MNLIHDQWIPVRRADGTTCRISPYEIGASDNPVVDISAPRPDFRGALYQFLIGLLQTAYAPEDDDEWLEKWENIPSCANLKTAFEKFADAFELLNGSKPAFMQDYNMPDKSESNDIRSLLIDAPGTKTLKENKDHFVKRDAVTGLCYHCSATALLTLQINAPSGGQGHRTGIRGGGPLTTLVLPETSKNRVWKILWLNVLTLEERFGTCPEKSLNSVFPWLGPTRESSGDKKTYPQNVDDLQQYWATPRRIRLKKETVSGTCDICGSEGELITGFFSKNFGVSYSSTWRHALSPYRFQAEKNGTTNLIPTKGKQGGFTYSDWLALTLGIDKNEISADVVNSVIKRKFFSGTDLGQFRIWCFGYDMDNMKARCWYDQTMPLIILDANKSPIFVETVQKLITASDDVAKILRDQIKAAWFKRPKDAKGDISFVINTFRDETETQFFSLVERLRCSIEKDQPTSPILHEWRKIIIEAADRLFNRFALQESDEPKNMKRISEAAKALTNILNSPKTESLQALKEGT